MDDLNLDTQDTGIEDKLAGLIDLPGVEGDDAPDTKEMQAQQEIANEQQDKEEQDAAAQEALEKEKTEKEIAKKDDEEFYELEASDLATIFGVDPNQIAVNDEGQVSVKTKVGEEIANVPLADLIKNYQIEKAITKKGQALSDERKNFETERDGLRDKYTQAIQGAVGLVTAMEQQLLSGFNTVDWNKLRVDNPAEFAAKNAEFQNARMQIENIKQHVAGQAKQYAEELNQQKLNDLQKIVEKEQALLVEAIPEFGDVTKAEETKNKLWGYLTTTYKFSEQDLSQVFDHRLIVLANKAMLFDQLQQKGSEAVKTIRKLPKVLKPGSQAQRSNQQDEARKKKIIKLKQSGKTEVLQDILLDRLGGNT